MSQSASAAGNVKGLLPDPPLAPDEFTGRKLGKYEIACRLSTGGMSEVFLAFQSGAQGFRKYVVLKRILEGIRVQDDVVRMFVQEAKITAGFSHSNIAQVFDLDQVEGELFLAMEFIAGATLVEVAKACITASEPIPTGLTLGVARDTALALHYAHTFIDAAGRSQPVIHRDVAEKNIMVTYEGVTKLLDFGIAKRLDRAGRTQIGTVKGTSGYMSPEQIRGESVDARSDVFSLGVVLHECLAGQRLFYRRSREEEMYAALHQDVHPPSRRNPEVPPALDAAVLRALSRDKADRFPTARDMARAIESSAGHLIWEPERVAAFMQRMFAKRREQTRELLFKLGGEDNSEIRPAPLGVSRNELPTRAERSSGPFLGGQGTGHDDPTHLATGLELSPEDPTKRVNSPFEPTPPAGPRRSAKGSLRAEARRPERPRRGSAHHLPSVIADESLQRTEPQWKLTLRDVAALLQERVRTPAGMMVAGVMIGLVMASLVYLIVR